MSIEKPPTAGVSDRRPGSGIVQRAWAPSVVRVGDWITGRCVTYNSAVTGEVAEVYGPIAWPDCGGYRYKLVNTGRTYSNGRPVESTVHAHTWAEQPAAAPSGFGSGATEVRE